jgi:hypothetical protein
MTVTVFKRLSALERRGAPVAEAEVIDAEFEAALDSLPVAELVALAEAIEADLLGVPVGAALTGLADAAWQRLTEALGAERLQRLFQA